MLCDVIVVTSDSAKHCYTLDDDDNCDSKAALIQNIETDKAVSHVCPKLPGVANNFNFQKKYENFEFELHYSRNNVNFPIS